MKKLFSYVLAVSLLTGYVSANAAEAAAKKAKPYTLNICLVTGEKLGGMGEPVKVEYQGQEFKFCCKGCIKQFNKEPEKFVKKLAEAEKAEKAKGKKKA
jgi:YHS domain-containing protein